MDLVDYLTKPGPILDHTRLCGWITVLIISLNRAVNELHHNTQRLKKENVLRRLDKIMALEHREHSYGLLYITII